MSDKVYGVESLTGTGTGKIRVERCETACRAVQRKKNSIQKISFRCAGESERVSLEILDQNLICNLSN